MGSQISVDVRGEPEVGDLQVEFIVQEKVFGFEVSMRDAVAVTIVDGVDQLVEIISCDLLLEATHIGNIPKELPGVGEVQYHVLGLVGLAVLLGVDAVLVVLLDIQDIGVGELGQDSNFVFEGLDVGVDVYLASNDLGRIIFVLLFVEGQLNL